ncbi:hypothetical protein AB0P17_17215 [Streptomyces sp. NPDC088124]|uniref:hypothetical protein n=1 Tax=Streptomyces sp. NPDC088124 TaxID=3154654 RepID=UPI0034499C8C
MTAASPAEVIGVRDHEGLAAMASCARQYVLAEGALHGRHDADGAGEITQQEFESTSHRPAARAAGHGRYASCDAV